MFNLLFREPRKMPASGQNINQVIHRRKDTLCLITSYVSQRQLVTQITCELQFVLKRGFCVKQLFIWFG